MKIFNYCLTIDHITKNNYYHMHNRSFIKEYGIFLNRKEYISSGLYDESIIRLSFDTFKNNRNALNLLLSNSTPLSPSFIKDYFGEFILNAALVNHPLLTDEAILELNCYKGVHNRLLPIKKFDENMLKIMYDRNLIFMIDLLAFQKVSDSFIRMYTSDFDKGEWDVLSSHQLLTNEFIMEFGHQLNWRDVIVYQTISIDVHMKYITEINNALHDNTKPPKNVNIQRKVMY